jgi:hypothetical protein
MAWKPKDIPAGSACLIESVDNENETLRFTKSLRGGVQHSRKEVRSGTEKLGDRITVRVRFEPVSADELDSQTLQPSCRACFARGLLQKEVRKSPLVSQVREVRCLAYPGITHKKPDSAILAGSFDETIEVLIKPLSSDE